MKKIKKNSKKVAWLVLAVFVYVGFLFLIASNTAEMEISKLFAIGNLEYFAPSAPPVPVLNILDYNKRDRYIGDVERVDGDKFIYLVTNSSVAGFHALSECRSAFAFQPHRRVLRKFRFCEHGNLGRVSSARNAFKVTRCGKSVASG